MLPLLIASSLVVATGSEGVVERSFSDAVRARVADGWTVADLRTEGDNFVITVRDGDTVERHLIGSFEGGQRYQVERDAKLPADPREPSEVTLQALSSPRGGLEIDDGCGELYELPYLVEGFAVREMAPRFVASTLATADDLSTVATGEREIKFAFERGGKARTLVVWTDDDGDVIEAQIRDYGGANDGTATYKRTRQLKQALRHQRVTRIDTKGTLKLVTPKGMIAIDPHGDAFDRPDHDYEGCGC